MWAVVSHCKPLAHASPCARHIWNASSSTQQNSAHAGSSPGPAVRALSSSSVASGMVQPARRGRGGGTRGAEVIGVARGNTLRVASLWMKCEDCAAGGCSNRVGAFCAPRGAHAEECFVHRSGAFFMYPTQTPYNPRVFQPQKSKTRNAPPASAKDTSCSAASCTTTWWVTTRAAIA